MTIAADPIPPDTRSIDEMPFGSGATDPLAAAKTVRDTLRRCGVNVAHEIEELGCTGASAKGLTTTQIAELRMGLAGGGVGLPCFVPPTLYCLAHSTIGGLQIGQAARFSEEIEKISRELAPRERGHVEMIEASRRVRGGDMGERLMKTADALSGRDLPPGVEREEEADAESEDSRHYRQLIEEDRATRLQPPRVAALRAPTLTADGDLIEQGFVCPEHRVPIWTCRYCVAQMIVEGPLEPEYIVTSAVSGGAEFAPQSAQDVEPYLAGCETEQCSRVMVFVRAAVFSRKLARD